MKTHTHYFIRKIGNSWILEYEIYKPFEYQLRRQILSIHESFVEVTEKVSQILTNEWLKGMAGR